MRCWIRRVFARPVIRSIRKAPPRRRLRVQALEDRRVPATFTVINTRDDGSAGTLRWAIGQANSFAGADTVDFDGTVFATPQTITLASTQLELTDELGSTTITGPVSGVVVDGGSASRLFQVNMGTQAAMSGLTIQRGHAATGGGLLNMGVVSLTNCTISGNTADGDGGGLFNASYVDGNGRMSLINCTVSGNRAGASNNTYGNGGGLTNNGNVSLINCTISGNTANAGGFYPGNGGGFWNSGIASLSDCTISGNSAQNDGGAVFTTGEMTLNDCTIDSNTAGQRGGAVFSPPNASITLFKSTISRNQAGRSGGGIENNGAISLTNCTVSHNRADPMGQNPGEGGGISNYGLAILSQCTISSNSGGNGGGLITGTDFGITTNMINTIVAGNSAAVQGTDILGPVNSQGHNLIGIADDSSGWVSTDLTGTGGSPLDAKLGPLTNNGGPTQTMALLSGSPAINAGVSVQGISSDQRGQPMSSPPDIGAFQTHSQALAPALSVAAGPGMEPRVNVYNSAGALIRSFNAYESSFRGGVHVVTTDVNGDTVPDTITSPGLGGGPVVRVWDGVTGLLINEFNAYDPLFRGGANIAVVQLLNTLDPPQIITGPGPGGGPHVQVFNGQTGAVLASFLAYDPSFTGGISVAATAATPGGPGHIITGAGPGGGPHVRVFSATGWPQGPGFMAYELSFFGGVNVAALRNSDIIAAPASGGGPLVREFSLSGFLNRQFLAYDAAFFGGVSLGVIPFGPDPGSAILTGAGPGGGPHVKQFDAGDLSTPLLSFLAFDPAFVGGVFVG
jgi:predicted outer membrane repeat protein